MTDYDDLLLQEFHEAGILLPEEQERIDFELEFLKHQSSHLARLLAAGVAAVPSRRWSSVLQQMPSPPGQPPGSGAVVRLGVR